MKKQILTFGLLLITFLIFGQETKYVDTDELNIRAGAGTKYEVLDKISQGQKVTVLSDQGKWSEIELENGQKGFVSTKLLSDTQNSSSQSSGKKNSWMVYLLIIGFVLYRLGKLFGGRNSNSSNSSQRNSSKSINEKPAKQIHICKYCGTKNEDLWRLTVQTCHNSPTKKHQPLEGGIQSEYLCKHCGTKSRDLWRLTAQTCHRSPTTKHQPHF